MNKISLLSATEDLVTKRVIKLLSGALVLLITFNLGWILTMIRICSNLAMVQNENKNLLNFDLLLILGNLSILALFLGYVFLIRSIRGILGRKA